MEDKLCPNCATPFHDELSVFCYECGVPVINSCSNTECEYNNDDFVPRPNNHKFCDACGAETEFMRLGYFED